MIGTRLKSFVPLSQPRQFGLHAESRDALLNPHFGELTTAVPTNRV